MQRIKFRRVRSLIESRAARRRVTPTLVMLAIAGVMAAGCGGGLSQSGGGSYTGTDGGGYESTGGTGKGTDDGGYESGTDSGEFNLLVQRGNTALGLSMECFTFYDGGTIELRHSGNQEVSDTGTFSGDKYGGEIAWDSGRNSTYEWDGSYWRVDGASGAVIDSCLV
jgi:hypothetical protein